MKMIGKIADLGFANVDVPHFMTGHHKIPRIWIIVVDRHVMRIFRKPDGHLEQIGEATPQKTVIRSYSFGRIVSSASKYIRHRLERHGAQKNSDDGKFVHDIVDWLQRAAKANAFDRLVLAASPKMLGDIRKYLPLAVQALIVAEVDKDLTKMNEEQLKQALQTVLWF